MWSSSHVKYSVRGSTILVGLFCIVSLFAIFSSVYFFSSGIKGILRLREKSEIDQLTKERFEFVQRMLGGLLVVALVCFGITLLVAILNSNMFSVTNLFLFLFLFIVISGIGTYIAFKRYYPQQKDN